MKELICIVCPNSCKLLIDENNKVSGHKCKRGEQFAIDEMTMPMRCVCTSVATIFKEMPVVSVRSDGEIPKVRMMDFMRAINKIVLDTKVERGSIVVNNILDLGINVITTADMINKY